MPVFENESNFFIMFLIPNFRKYLFPFLFVIIIAYLSQVLNFVNGNRDLRITNYFSSYKISQFYEILMFRMENLFAKTYIFISCFGYLERRIFGDNIISWKTKPLTFRSLNQLNHRIKFLPKFVISYKIYYE